MTKPTATVLCVSLILTGCAKDPDPFGPARDPVWEAHLPTEFYTPQRAAVSGGVVLVQSDRQVAALSLSDGAIRWRMPVPESRINPVHVAGPTVVKVEQGIAGLYDLETGALKQSFGGAEFAVSRESVFVATGRDLTAYDVSTGAQRWRRSFTGKVRPALPGGLPDKPMRMVELNESLWKHSFYSDPLLAQQATVVAASVKGANGWTTTLLDPSSGKDLRPLTPALDGDERLPAISNIATGRLLATGRAYITWDPKGKICPIAVTVHDAGTGRPGWSAALRYPMGCANQFGPVVSGTRIVVYDNNNAPQLRELDTGEVKWAGTVGDVMIGATADVVLTRAGQGEGDLVAVDLTTNRPLWSRTTFYAANDLPKTVWVSGDRFVFGVRQDRWLDFKDVEGITHVHIQAARTGEVLWRTNGDRNYLLDVGQETFVTYESTSKHIAVRLFRLN